MKQKTKPFYFLAIALFLTLGFASMIAVAKNDNSNGDGGNKDKKTESSSGNEEKKNVKSPKTVNLKNYEKADTSKGETNAQIHKEKTTQVIKKLEQEKIKEEPVTVSTEASTEEVTLQVEAKNKAKKQIAQVVMEQEASQEVVTEAMEEVENDGVAKKFFLGPDYKNLGQLRSELVHNRNQIRQLNQAVMTLSQAGEDTTALTEQLAILTQERERIKSIILANESSFSLFGWVSRFLANYEETPINEAEENELIEETQEILDNTEGIASGDDTSTETTPDTTPADTPSDTTETAPLTEADTIIPPAGIDTTPAPQTDASNTTATTTPDASVQPAAN